MATIDELTWSSLTETVNEIKPVQDFLARLLFSNHKTLSTETIEIGTKVGGRQVAPFVRKNGEAVLVKGRDKTFATVEAPNIRIKQPFSPSALLFGREPGSVIFPSTDEQISAIEAHIADDLQDMADKIDNAIEFLASQVLTGTISYSVEDQENFTITYPRPANNNMSAAAAWDGGSPQILNDVMSAKRQMNLESGLSPTDAIMDTEATTVFINDSEVQTLLDNRNVDFGTLELQNQFSDQGAMYLGRLGGIRWWEYSRQLTLDDGTSADMIRAETVEFVHAGPAAENILYFGAIPDMDAFQGRTFQSERFAKSWMVDDPSVMMALLHSRPLPVPRRPGSYISLDVS